MFVYIILLWILINMSAPAWTYVLLGIAAFIRFLNGELNLQTRVNKKNNLICEIS